MTQPSLTLDALLAEMRPALVRHRMRSRHRLLRAAAVVAAGATATVALGATYGHWLSSPTAFRTLSRPIPLPTFSGADLLTGKHISNESIAGHGGFVLFWQSYCPPCKGEIGAVQSFAKSNPSVPVVGFDINDIPSLGRKLLNQLGAISFPSIIDNGLDIRSLGINGYPTMLAFNKNGDVVAISIGYGGTISTDLITEEAGRLG